ncbi:hypothetical protein D3C87_735440 [compost metagenome]
MKKALIVVISLSAIVFTSCKEDQPKPKVIYEEAKSSKDLTKKIDSTEIKVADLPVHMEGTKYLIHPVGDIRIYDDSNRSYGSSRTNSSVSYAISNYNRFEITGYFENLKFQHIDSTTIRPLTNKKIQIQTATYLNTVAARFKHQVLIYTLVDDDTNKDGKVDANDIRALYISDISGKGFKKLSHDVQELIDWNLIETKGRIYFRTIEDINKNGAFDKNDKVHYHFVDLLSPEWTVTSYEPVN